MHWLWDFVRVSAGHRCLESVISENGEGNVIGASSFSCVNIDACQGSVNTSESQLELRLE